MRIDLRHLVPPALAVLVLLMTLRQTSEALQRSGAWQRHAPLAKPADPYALLDAQIARRQLDVETDALRDPFGYGVAPRPSRVATRAPGTSPLVPAPPPSPVLTSITWSDDADPRATLRYNGRDYTVGENGLFDEYRVRSITRSQVVLERNGERQALTLRSKGE